MTMIRKIVPATVTALGDDEVEIIMSTAGLARDGHILVPQGALLDNYRKNPIVLWQHDPEHPVGNAEELAVSPDTITARVRFAPLGATKKADETRALVKAGVVRAVSIGFDPIEGEPLDPKRPRGGQRFTKWELLECSFVSVPADTSAVVTARAEGAQTRMTPRKNAKKRAAAFQPTFKRGLWEVAELACTMANFGWTYDSAKWEAAIEADGSEVPAMLGQILVDMGDALIAMTQEEVAEYIAGKELDEEDDAVVIESLEPGEREHIAAATNPKVRAWRTAMAVAKTRAGKKLSAATVESLRDAMDCHEEGIEHHRAAMKAHKRGMQCVRDLMDRAGVEDDTDPKETQTSAGTEEDEGSRDFRRRQADKLNLNLH